MGAWVGREILKQDHEEHESEVAGVMAGRVKNAKAGGCAPHNQ
jgi:hypothetical protein